MKFEATNGCAFGAFKAARCAQMPLLGACVLAGVQLICEVWNVFIQIIRSRDGNQAAPR